MVTARNSHAGRRTGLQMGYGKVFVAGGAKGVGRAVIDKLVQQGSEVVALVRREDAKAELDAVKGGLKLKKIITGVAAYTNNSTPFFCGHAFSAMEEDLLHFSSRNHM